jgi:hypothetical protein
MIGSDFVRLTHTIRVLWAKASRDVRLGSAMRTEPDIRKRIPIYGVTPYFRFSIST